ncbi:hypothetical protein P7K49_033656 [Saguinus oedipus]|uniref:RNA polymerase II elongation factor ELL N-terminal domain-containing protein n=1 Tax=Saguinus oedipus TaxID=9490 RepID=A0ABQ9TSJ0_SAGOE|nr:hypothetical protein P7K49_033656 [Saguinus oedipus]
MAALKEARSYGLSCGRVSDGSKVSVFHVKLTDSALRAFESYSARQVSGMGPGEPVGDVGAGLALPSLRRPGLETLVPWCCSDRSLGRRGAGWAPVRSGAERTRFFSAPGDDTGGRPGTAERPRLARRAPGASVSAPGGVRGLSGPPPTWEGSSVRTWRRGEG